MLFMLMFLYYLFIIMGVLMGVAFFTLLERKVLGFVQLRYGPNKVSFIGIFQPFSDAVKLLMKGSLFLLMSSGFKYLLMPYFMFTIMMSVWIYLPTGGWLGGFINSGLILISILSLMVYPIMMGSWFSGCSYSMLGGIRSVAQMISYEVSFITILMSFFYMVGTYGMGYFFYVFTLFLIPSVFMIFISMLMELNRTPADLIEGESELVSGFNTEYGGFNFALIFLAEYGMIMFMGLFFFNLVLGIYPFSLLGGIFLCLYIFLVIIIRGVLPRIRYDCLMYMCWSVLLSLSLGYLIYLIGMLTFLW